MPNLGIDAKKQINLFRNGNTLKRVGIFTNFPYFCTNKEKCSDDSTE